MSYFFRQYHVMSKLKAGKEKEILPLYKALSPILSLHPAVQKLHTQSLTKNMQLNVNENAKSEKTGKNKKSVAVILSWMLAKDSHLDKYRSLYLNRGFDVLTVNMAPKDLLFPASGSQVTATNLLEYLKENNYEDVLFHAFSVGAYFMGEMFVKVRDNDDKYKSILPKIQGVILDSAVDFEGIPTGFPRALTKNPITVTVLEWYIATHLAVMYNVATKHYLRSSKNFHNTPLRCPALIISSESDKVGSPRQNYLLGESWELRGVDVKYKTFKDSKHVSHMYQHPEEYTSEIDSFLTKIKLHSNKQ